MNIEWNNDMIMEFLDLYEAEPALWDLQNKDHKDRSKVHEAWKRIQSNFSVECSPLELKRKKDCLMATYRKLAMKVRTSSGYGDGTNQSYKPDWFAYDKMASFLHTIYTPREIKTETPCEDESRTSVSSYSDSAVEINFPENKESTEQSLVLSARSTPSAPLPKRQRMTSPIVELKELLPSAWDCQYYENSQEPQNNQKIPTIATVWGEKLLTLDPQQRLFAEKAINDILFEATMGNLHRYSVTINDNF